MKNLFMLLVFTVITTVLPCAVSAQQRPPIFFEDFEGATEEYIPAGWSNDRQYGYSKWEYKREGVDGSACYSYKTVGFMSGYGWLISPSFKLDKPGYALYFDYKVGVNADIEGIGLFIHVSYDNGKTFSEEPIAALKGYVSEWKRMAVPLPVSPTGEMSIGFFADKDDPDADYYELSASIDNVSVDIEPRCAAPVDLRAIGIGSDTVALSWGFAQSGQISQEVEVSLTRGGSEIRRETLRCDHQGRVVLRSLENNSTYSVRLRMDCEGAYLGKSEWSDAVQFTTLCPPAGLPLSYTFDDLTSAPDCWSSSGGSLQVSHQYVFGNAGKSLEIISDDENTYVYSVPIAHAANDMEISMMVYYASSGSQELEVGLQSNIKAAGTYSGLESFTIPGYQWTKITIYTSGTLLGAREDVSVVFWLKNFNWRRFYVDNLTIRRMPTCRNPQGVKVTTFDNKSATFTWNAVEGQKLEVYSVSETDTLLLGALEKPGDVLTGLEENKAYKFMFKGSCGDEKSGWGMNSVEIRTSCSQVPPPISEGFEEGVIPFCWGNEGYHLLDNRTVYWEVATDRKATGQHSVKLSAVPYNPHVLLTLPYMTLPQDEDYILRFYMFRQAKYYNTYTDLVNVYVNGRPDTDGATLLGTVHRNVNLTPVVVKEGWYRYEFDLPVKGDTYVIVEGVSNNGGAMYLDDIEVVKKPTCAEPKNLMVVDDSIKQTSVRVEWDKQEGISMWELSYSHAAAPDPVKIIVENAEAYTLTGLTPNTRYDDFRVELRAICAEGDTSTACFCLANIKTPCEMIDVRTEVWREDLRNGSLDCYEVLDGAPEIKKEGLKFIGIGGMVVLPEFIYDDLADYKLYCKWQVIPDYKYTTLEAGVITDLSDISTFVPLDTIIAPDETMKTYGMSFDGYTGQPGRIALRYYNRENTWQSFGLLEYLELRKRRECPDVETVEAVDILDTVAGFSVVCDGSSEAFDVEYGPKGFTLGEGTQQTGLEAPLYVKGLSPSTEYDIYVRSACAARDGAWSTAYTFRTLCGSVAVSDTSIFFDDFETTADCWKSFVVDSGNMWHVMESSYDAHGGSRYARLSTSHPDPAHADIFGAVSLEAGRTYEFSCYMKFKGKDGGLENVLKVACCNSMNPKDEDVTEILSMDLEEDFEYKRIKATFTPKKDASLLRLRAKITHFNGGLFIDDVRIVLSECECPENVYVSRLADNGATVRWQAVNAASYNVKVFSSATADPVKDKGDVLDATNITATVFEIPDLQPGTDYRFYVQGVCADGGKSAWSAPVHIHTLCTAETLPFGEFFDEEDALECWMTGSGSASVGNIYGETGKSCIMSSGVVTNIVTPTFDMPTYITGCQMTLRVYVPVGEVSISVGVVPNPGDLSDIWPVAEFKLKEMTEWEELYVYFDEALADAGEYAKAKNIIITSSDLCYIDDFELQTLPKCPEPYGLSVDDISANKATLKWSIHGGGKCHVAVIRGGETVKEYDDAESPLLLTELEAVADYVVEVSPNCAGQPTDAVKTVFSTPCSTFAFPFRENFESYKDGDMPGCWSDAVKGGPSHTSTSKDNKWSVVEEYWGDKTLITSPCIKFDAYINPSGNTCLLQTPPIDLKNVANAELGFMSIAPTGAIMHVVISTDGGKTFADTVVKNLTFKKWTESVYDLSTYCGKEIIVGFLGISNYGTNSLYVDDIRVSPAVKCKKPQALVASDAGTDRVRIVIDDLQNITWQVAIGERGFNPDTLTAPADIVTKDTVLEGLRPGTIYEAYVRSDCGTDGYGVWVGPEKFYTMCAPKQPDYHEGFEKCETKEDLLCFEVLSPVGMPMSDYEIETNVDHVIDGTRSLSFTNSGMDSYMLLPEIDADIENLMLTLTARVNRDMVLPEIGLIHKDSVKHLHSSFVKASRLVVSTEKSTGSGYFAVSGRTGRDYRIVLRVPATGSSRLTVDELHVDVTPLPLIHTIDGVTDYGAVIRWIAPAGTQSAEIMLNGGIPVKADGMDTHALSALTPDTEYEVRVRCIKGVAAGDTTVWSEARKFRTHVTPASLPYSCGFEADEPETSLWNIENGGSDISWIVSDKDENAVYEGQKALYVVGEEGTHSYAGIKAASVYAYRTFSLDANVKYRLSFMYHSNGIFSYYYDNPDNMKALLVPSGTDNVTASIDRIDISEPLYRKAEWTLYEGEVKVPQTGFYDLVFLWENAVAADATGSHLPAAVDSVVFEEITCMSVEEVKADSVRGTSANIVWTDLNRKEHTIEYALLTGNEEFDEEKVKGQPVSGDTLRLKDLTPESDYMVYLRTLCGDYYTPWSDPVEFTTPCAAVLVDADNEFVDDFEEGYYSKYLGCWKHYHIGANQYSWQCATAYDPSLPYSGEVHIIARTDETVIMTRLFELKAGLNYQLMFQAAVKEMEYPDGTAVGIYIGGEFDEATELDEIETIEIQSPEYAEYTYRFNVDKDDVYKIGVKGIVGDYARLVAVDSLVMRTVECEMPISLEITDITATSALVTWSGTADKYKVTVTAGAESNSVEVDKSEYEIKDLDGSTSYAVEVSSICPDGGYSDAAELVFTTSCEGMAVAPYYEEFGMFGSIPPCWNAGTGDADNPWSFHREDNGNGVMMFESDYNYKFSSDTLVSVSVSVPETGYAFSMDYINPEGGPLSVYLSDDRGASVTDTLLYQVTGASAWRSASINLDAYAGKSVTVIAAGVSSYTRKQGAYALIDNFRIAKVSETKEFSDTVCYGEPYMEYGFAFPSGVLSYGSNTITRVEHGAAAGEPDTLYSVTVFVPNSDVYIKDIFAPGTTYSGYGFEGITKAGYDYTRILESSLGCDSTVHLELVQAIVDIELFDTICEGERFPFCGEEKEVSGTYTCTEKGSVGLDSVTTLHLTVLPKLVERVDTVCQGDFVLFDGKELKESGVYEADSVYPKGCPYKSKLILTVIDSVVKFDTTICKGRYVEIDGQRYRETGSYRIPMESIGECDRTLILNLTVNPADTFTYHTQACEGRPIYDNGFAGTIVTKDTVMYRTDRTADGCDSVTELVVEFFHKSEAFDTVHTAEKVYEYDGRTLTTGGDYTSTGIDVNGCDSTHHLHITFTTGVDNAGTHNLIIAPNPADNGSVAYAYGDWGIGYLRGMRLEVFDETGRKICDRKVTQNPVALDDVTAAGIYFVCITASDGTVYTGRLMVR